MANIQLLEVVLARLEQIEEREFDMSYWGLDLPDDGVCNTAACLAGHIVLAMGCKLVFTKGYDRNALCRDLNGRVRPISDVAAEGVEIDLAELTPLFGSTDWDRDQIIEVVKYLTKGDDVSFAMDQVRAFSDEDIYDEEDDDYCAECGGPCQA